MDAEDRDVAAARVHCEEERVVLAEGQGALRFERVAGPSAAATMRVIGDTAAESAIGSAFEGDHLILVGVIGHYEYGTGGVVGLGRDKDWESDPNSNGKHQETSSYLQHFPTPWDDRPRKTRGSEDSADHRASPGHFAQLLEQPELKKVTGGLTPTCVTKSPAKLISRFIADTYRRIDGI